MSDDTVGTPEAARMLGVSRVRVIQLIQDGRLPAERVGRDWRITRGAVRAALDRDDYRRTARPRSPGRAGARG